MFNFTLSATDSSSAARAGVLTTDHGVIRTPIFMPVGTVGSVKGVYHRDLSQDIKAQIILGNTPCSRQAVCINSNIGTAPS